MNTEAPSEVTELGSDTLVTPEQPAKAPTEERPAAEPNATTLVGIVTDVMPVQDEKAPLATVVMVIEMTMAPLQHAFDGWVPFTQPVVAVSASVGFADGFAVGFEVGLEVGLAVGLEDGRDVGICVDWAEVGRALGFTDGFAVGFAVGVAVGFADGFAVGFAVGLALGSAEGFAVGSADGAIIEILE